MTKPVRVDLWIWPLTYRDAAQHVLSPTEKARAARFMFDKHRHRYVAGRAQLRRILGRYLKLSAHEVPLDADQNGKPHAGAHALPFNLSHTGDIAALAVARDGGNWRIGVDIEGVRSVKERISEFAFSAAEQEALASLPEGEPQISAFFAGWTRKEAYLKAVGSGLLAPLDGFDVELAPAAPEPTLVIRDPNESTRGWRLFSFEAAPNTPGALAIDVGDLPVDIRLRRLGA